ncbi:MAG: OFA family MFS transporter [Planctomycetes bacterium]|nr:OFA family MFS transporter [Planctomycetota bacterium]MBU1518257.1 OFA family MFS transporter [Planctomycetota bacterium]MBU2457788.1 OFA family MFS transporter [Planctomycetota bacterium]
MSEGKVMNRWLVVAGGILIQLCLGAIYAWSAFTKKLTIEPYGFSKTETQWVFAIGLVTFAVIMALIAGKWQKKAGPRKVALTGGLVLGAGYLLAGFSGANFWGILIGIGVLGGAGIGLAYVCPIAALAKWFPDKKGLIMGLAVAGFGFGALIWVKLTQGFQFGPIDLTSGWTGLFGAGLSISAVFKLYGIMFAVLVGIGSIFMVNPPDGWLPPGWTPPETGAGSEGRANFTPIEMARTYQFWLLFFNFTVGAMAGLMVIGIIKLFGIDALAGAGIDDAKASVITGTAMGLFYALFNGFGRIIWGMVSDKLGRKNSIVLMNLIQGVMMIGFFFMGGNEWGLYIGATVIGFNFGGNFALFPAATADLFGNKNVGINYPWVFMAFGVGGLIGPMLGGYMGDHQVWMWAFIPAGAACLIAGLLATRLKPVETAPVTTA